MNDMEEQNTEDLWHEYFNAALNGDYATSVLLIERLAEVDPQNPIVLMEMGALQFDSEDLSLSLETFHRTAETFLSGGMLQNALSVYRTILKLDPYDAEAFIKVHEIENRLLAESKGPAPAAEGPAAKRQPDVIPRTGRLIERVPRIFATLSKDEVAEVEKKAVHRAYPDGEVVFNEGDLGDSMFLIKGGKAIVTIEMEKSNPLVIASLGEGDIFGEMALLKKRPRTATVTALGELVVMEIVKDTLKEFAEKHPEIVRTLVDYYNTRAKDSSRKTQQ